MSVVAKRKHHSSDSTSASPPTFKEFQVLCHQLEQESSRNIKTSHVLAKLGLDVHPEIPLADLSVWCKLLMYKVDSRTYNMGRKQMIKLCSALLDDDGNCTPEAIQQAYDHHPKFAGDLPMIMSSLFKPALKKKPRAFSLHEIDSLLTSLSGATAEHGQMSLEKKQELIRLAFIDRGANQADILYLFRILEKDLKIGCGAQGIMNGIHPQGYAYFKVQSDIDDVLTQLKALAVAESEPAIDGEIDSGHAKKRRKVIVHRKKKAIPLSAQVHVGKPFKPMLAKAVKSYDAIVKQCGNIIYVETKVDGHRCFTHMMQGAEKFRFFARSMKPMKPENSDHIQYFLPEALCPTVSTAIFDGEVLLMDVKTGVPFPMSELGKHAREKYAPDEAVMCYVIFDLVYLNGENLMTWPLHKRREKLEEIVTPIPNRILFSDLEKTTTKDKIESLMEQCMEDGLEGLMLKNSESTYEPGKRGWLKIKKDYLQEGAMADSADLVVLGGYMGKGRFGGIMSKFLMGTYDKTQKKWLTVTRLANGFSDEQLHSLQKELAPLMKESEHGKTIPDWIDVTRKNVPHYFMKDPWKAPVWEVAGAQFTRSHDHTAHGISIRFPKLVRVRPDKDAAHATNLAELCHLCIASGQTDPRLLELLNE